MTARALATQHATDSSDGRALQEHYEAEQRSADAARDRRNQWVRDRLGEGWTHKRIAEELGLSRGRIGQMK